ncbi:MAG: asparagine--tRNA ligase [Bacteroidales bacterium]|nr:asparagine--tRNA ligase [Bacteroidales bacterium]
MKKMTVKEALLSKDFNSEITVMGWVRTKRTSKNVAFVALNDGSTLQNIQLVFDASKFPEKELGKVTTGAALEVKGTLTESAGTQQSCEITVSALTIVGESDPDLYPLQPKKHSLEFLREIAHLRFRTNTFSAIFRIRHHMIFAVHQFFNDKGFYNIHTPIITASDAEGAGEMFHVSVLNPLRPPLTEEGKINYKEDFFGRETSLTVSGQLEAELAALALSKVYTFGPTFRAENSNTSRHLAEFWMIEPEVAFNDIKDNMDLAEEMLKYVIRYALNHCYEDLQFLENRQKEEEKSKPQDQRSEMSLIEKLHFVIDNNFERITYTEAIEILKASTPNKKKKFQYLVEDWGIDLQSEHERYLVEKHFKKPVILTDYPKEIKAFYMKQNEDGKTVRAMDVLFPQIGEIIGGSQREEHLETLLSRMKALKMSEKEMWWYIDSRRFGTVPHSGYGLGFERLMLFITGMTNIRDVIPFPRTPQNADF